MTRLLQELPNRIKWLNTKFTVDSFRKRFSSLSLCKSHFLFRIIIFRIYYYSQINKIEIVTIIRIFRSYFIYIKSLYFHGKPGRNRYRGIFDAIDKSSPLSMSSVFTYPSGREPCPSLWAVLFSISSRKLA